MKKFLVHAGLPGCGSTKSMPNTSDLVSLSSYMTGMPL